MVRGHGKKDFFNLFLFAWTGFIVLTTCFWIFRNSFPVSWDQAQYLEASEILHQTLADNGPIAFIVKTSTILPTKAPLIAMLPVSLYFLFWSSVEVALIVNLIFLTLFFIFFFELVRLLFDKTVAITSLIIISTMPLFYGLTHYFLVEFGLMTIVVIWMFVLLKTQYLTDRKYLFLLGLITGFGFLMKLHFLIFIIGPAILILYESWRKIGNKILSYKNILLFALPAFAVALPWYSRNILTLLWKAKRSVNPELLGDLYYGSAFSVKNLYLSGVDFINYVISPFWSLTLTFFGVIFICKRMKVRLNYFLVSWFLIPFVIFYFGPNKDYRLMLPLLPPVSILIAWLMRSIFSKKYFFVVAFLLIFPLLVYLNTTALNAKLFQKEISFGPLRVVDAAIGYVGVPRKELFPIQELLKFIAQLEPSAKQKNVVLASEDEAFNINGLQYYATLNRLPIKVTTASYFSKGTSYNTIQDTIDKGDYLIMKVGGNAGPSDLNRFNHLILQNLDYAKWYEVSNSFSLPDGGNIKIWRKNL